MTSNEIGVHLGRTAAVLGRAVGVTLRVLLPLLLAMLVLGGRLLRRTAVLLVAMIRTQLAATRTTPGTRGAALPSVAPRLARR